MKCLCHIHLFLAIATPRAIALAGAASGILRSFACWALLTGALSFAGEPLASAVVPVRVTLAQLVVSTNIDSNLNRIRRAFGQAQQDGADWIVFPECALSGFTPRIDPARVAAAFEIVRELCRNAAISAVIGTSWREDDKTYNQLRVVDARGQLVAAYSKMCLTYSEAKGYAPGTVPGIVDVAGLRIGLLICNDLWVTPGYSDGPNPHLSRQLAKAGAQIIIHAVNSGPRPEFRGFHEENLKVRAAEARCPIVVVNAAARPAVNCTSGVVEAYRYAAELPREGEWIRTVVVNARARPAR